jgi:TetR/AcrR family transcriptional regulator, regulator of cefoperazone and chloramphenicol sensitivity
MAELDRTRRAILEAAGPLFASKGFDAVTVREITRDAGMNVAAVNYHFRSKEDLYVESVRLAAELCANATPLPTWVEDVPAEQKLRDYIRAFLTRLLRDDEPEWHRQLIMRELAQPRCGATEVFVENFVRPTFNTLLTILRDLLPAQVPAEELHLIGGSIVAQCLHQHHARHVTPLLVGPREYRSYTIERLTEHIWRFSLAALRGLHPPREKGERR